MALCWCQGVRIRPEATVAKGRFVRRVLVAVMLTLMRVLVRHVVHMFVRMATLFLGAGHGCVVTIAGGRWCAAADHAAHDDGTHAGGAIVFTRVGVDLTAVGVVGSIAHIHVAPRECAGC